jgi:DMSO/TMAO reductase YedYZ molybdopterin-dependent catalytic subunit
MAQGAALAVVACQGKGDSDGAAEGGADTQLQLDSIEPITANEDFYVTSCCGSPEIDRATWTLDVLDSTTAEPAPLTSFTLADFEAMTGVEKEHTLECIGGGPYHQAISNAVWRGLPFRDILAQRGVEVPMAAVEIKFTGADGYTTSLPIADLDTPFWLVWRMNGEPLPVDHGTCVRALTPGRYGMKNPKWIVLMEFIAEPYLGFWETIGWSNEAPYKPNAFIRTPEDRATLDAGPFTLVGTAFAGADPVVSVEVSLDDGLSWAPAELTYSNGPDIWALWRYEWEATAGTHALRVRATTEAGAETGQDPLGTDPTAGYDGGMRVEVEVL